MRSSKVVRPKIKPPRKHGAEVPIDETWAKLANNIREIQNHNASNLSFEENHRYGYNMVLYKQGAKLYDGVTQLVVEHLDGLASEQIIPTFPAGGLDDPVQQSQQGELLLKAVHNVWEDHTSSMSKLSQILKYMDRVYTKTEKLPEVYDQGLKQFLERILRPPLDQNIIQAILSQIQIERDGFTVNRSAIKGAVDVYLHLRIDLDAPTVVYKRDLEPAILRESRVFYEAEGGKLLASCDASTFLQRVEARFEAEEARTHHYLSSQTSQPLQELLQETLLTKHLPTVINMKGSGLDTMVDLNKMDDLARMYKLCMMVPTGQPCLKNALKASIGWRGKEINATSLGLDKEEVADDPKGKGKARETDGPKAPPQTLALALKWVQDVLDLKDVFDGIWRDAFAEDRVIESSMNDAFESFVNANDKAPEFISLFIDENLKKGLKGKTDSEIDVVLDKTITVFRFVTEKDVFERYYKAHLSKRLLSGRSVSDDAERGMISKLKVECGFQFTQKLEGMFQDMKTSADTMKAYEKHISSSATDIIDISVIVGTSTYWPIPHAPPSCNLPDELLQSCQSFEKFYLSRHSGRRLTWHLSMGHADVRVAFKKRTHDLTVSTLALVVLLLFKDLRDDEFLTYEEIKNATGIADTELKRQLQSLACAKYKVLKKHPSGRDVAPDNSFSFNDEFTAPLQKIKIQTVISKVESGKQRKETRDRVDEERNFTIEACLVRIMKSRKHLGHNELVSEATRQLSARFLPEPSHIKKRIEVLIEKEYFTRGEDRKSYDYVA